MTYLKTKTLKKLQVNVSVDPEGGASYLKYQP